MEETQTMARENHLDQNEGDCCVRFDTLAAVVGVTGLDKGVVSD